MADDLGTLEALLDRHGPGLAGWPAAERDWAQALIGREPRARALVAEAVRLDALLRSALPAPAPAALQARLASLPARHPARSWRWLLRRHSHPLGAATGRVAWGASMATLAAAVALLGVVTGVSEPPPLDDEVTVELASLAYGPQLELEDRP